MFKETMTVAFFVIGNLVGAGFFMMPAAVAPLGFNLLWSWSVGALIAFTFALIFGKLYMIFPESNDLTEYFDDFHLKQTVAWLYWIGIVAGNVIVLTMVITVLRVKTFSTALILVAFFLVLIASLNDFLSARQIALIESFLSFSKFSLLVLLPLAVFFTNPSVKFPSASGELADVLKIGVLSFWSFMGIETAGVFGNGKAARNGLFIGIIACFFLYVSSCFLIIGSLPPELLMANTDIPLIHLIRISKFSFLANYVIYLVAFTSLASLYGWFATSSKLAFSFAKNGLFPKFFSKANKSSGSIWGLWLAADLTFLIFAGVAYFEYVQQFELIAEFCVNISLIVFALCANSLYLKSQCLFDEIVSLFGMFLVFALLSINAKFSLFSCFLFVVFYYLSKYFNSKTCCR